MKKFWRVMVYEYTRHVLRKRFLFGLLSVPLIMAVMALVVFLLVRSETDHRPVGYIDRSGLLADPVQTTRLEALDQPVEMIPFEQEDRANQALKAKQIQAYFVLEEDFLQRNTARAVSLKNLSSSARNQFETFVQANLLAGQPPTVMRRLAEGSDLVVRSADGSRQMGEDDWINIFTPFLTGFAFMIAMFTASGYLMQAVVEEKENRTMEMLITSVSPMQLMSGKVIGIIGVGLTQLCLWIGVAALAILVGRNYVEWLNVIRFAPGSIGLLVVILVPSFVMVSALMAAIGATVTEEREGQQITGLFTLPVVIPYWFTYQLMSNPNGPLAVGLSFFPLTAPVTLTMRLGFTFIPTWQLVINIAILVLSALAALWLAGRTFRLGMLQYGQRLSLRQIFSKAA